MVDEDFVFGQGPYRCKMDWGLRGARNAAARGDIVVIVDVLSFSSAVISATQKGVILYPYPMRGGEWGSAADYAEQLKLELLPGRAEALKTGQPSLSPVSFTSEHAGQAFVISSLNGAACISACADGNPVLVGGLVNAGRIAEEVNRLISKSALNATLVACGEQWGEPRKNESILRPCIEDYLGAGAIISKIEAEKSAEAQVCQAAFEACKGEVRRLVREGSSGRELAQKGYRADVEFSSALDTLDAVPCLVPDEQGRMSLRA